MAFVASLPQLGTPAIACSGRSDFLALKVVDQLLKVVRYGSPRSRANACFSFGPRSVSSLGPPSHLWK